MYLARYKKHVNTRPILAHKTVWTIGIATSVVVLIQLENHVGRLNVPVNKYQQLDSASFAESRINEKTYFE